MRLGAAAPVKRRLRRPSSRCGDCLYFGLTQAFQFCAMGTKHPIMKALCITFLLSLLPALALAREPESTPKDRQLIEAVYRLRIDEVKKLVAEGASVKVRYGDHSADDAFRNQWDLGYPMVYRKWTALLALSDADILPAPPRKVTNTIADREWAWNEAAKIPEKEKDVRRKLKLEIAKILIEAGADVNADDGHGATALYNSAADSPGVALLLLQHGARVNTRTRTYIDDPGGMSPLHRAVPAPENLAALIQAGADLNAVDGSGDTALHLAVHRENVASVKLLLDAGADGSIKNKKGKRAVDLVPDEVSDPEKRWAISRLFLPKQPNPQNSRPLGR